MTSAKTNTRETQNQIPTLSPCPSPDAKAGSGGLPWGGQGGGGQGIHKAPGSLGEAAAGPGAPLTCVLEAKKGELGSPRDFSFTNEG